MRSIGAIFFRMKIRSIGTKFFPDEDPVNQYKVFPHPEKVEKHSHNFDQNIRQRRSVTKYSHNSPDFCKPSAESARIYKCQAEREAEKQKHFIKTRTSKIKKKSDIKRRKNNDRYDEHGNQ